MMRSTKALYAGCRISGKAKRNLNRCLSLPLLTPKSGHRHVVHLVNQSARERGQVMRVSTHPAATGRFLRSGISWYIAPQPLFTHQEKTAGARLPGLAAERIPPPDKPASASILTTPPAADGSGLSPRTADIQASSPARSDLPGWRVKPAKPQVSPRARKPRRNRAGAVYPD